MPIFMCIFREKVRVFLDGLVSHYMLDGGRLAVAHAGIKEHYQGRGSVRVRDFCLYGETTGETDEYGLPIRLDWTSEYRGRALVAYGHIPHIEPEILNNTYGIDTGCVFGGKLTALRYPEKILVSVPAKAVYYEPAKPLVPETVEVTDDLTLLDVHGRMHVQTRLMPVIDIREAQTAAALEVMSRFAADPHWLIYLPPTMSPCETSEKEDFLEYPDEAFAYYRKNGIRKVVCEKKHMGSRCVIVLCRSAESLGIRVILDGVFSHTGADSKYFNRYGNYPDKGACQGQDSPYYSWYEFRHFPDDYRCWWGFQDLPEVEETNPAWQEYVVKGKDSVVKTWLRRGRELLREKIEREGGIAE